METLFLIVGAKTGLEPATPTLARSCLYQLSYFRICFIGAWCLLELRCKVNTFFELCKFYRKKIAQFSTSVIYSDPRFLESLAEFFGIQNIGKIFPIGVLYRRNSPQPFASYGFKFVSAVLAHGDESVCLLFRREGSHHKVVYRTRQGVRYFGFFLITDPGGAVLHFADDVLHWKHRCLIRHDCPCRARGKEQKVRLLPQAGNMPRCGQSVC